MKLTDIWLIFFFKQLIYFFFTWKQPKQNWRGRVSDCKHIYAREVLHETFLKKKLSNPAENTKLQWRKAIQWFHGNWEELCQLMFKEMLFNHLLILSHDRWDMIFMDSTSTPQEPLPHPPHTPDRSQDCTQLAQLCWCRLNCKVHWKWFAQRTFKPWLCV